MLQVAVIGSGPAGCYLAERLVREAPGCKIDVIDRLPTPYGLVRAGVAPDHQSTKAITRVFDRVLTRDGVTFWGNITVGSEVSLEELRRLYDAVVIATGAPADKRLGIPGEDLPGVIGSGAFVGWYNGHPDHAAKAPELGHVRSAVVIGNGNVAIDVARILAKTPVELATSDMAPEIERALVAAPLSEIHVIGRRGPAEAGFSPKELGEIGELARARPVVRKEDLPTAETAPNPAIIAILRDFASRRAEAKPVSLHFHFHARPASFNGADRVAEARFARAEGGAELVLPADLVVSCIGYRAIACDALTPDGVFANEAGRIEPGLYVVGWAKRGPSGTIATNRAEAHEVAQRLAAETLPSERPGREGLAHLLAERNAHPVDYAGWLRIDAAERARAEPGRPREKFAELAALLKSAKIENN